MKTNTPGKNTSQSQIKTTTPAQDQPAQAGSNPHFRNDTPITGSEDTVQPITPETLPAPRSPLPAPRSLLPALRSPLSAPRLVALFLFFTALLPRLPGLGRFLTSDENTNIFFAGSDVIAAFLKGDFRGTYWHFYPGVTMSWLDAAGLTGQYWLDILSGRTTLPFTEYIYGDILSLVVAARLPYVILTAAAVPVFYLLARKLLPERMALFGSLFLAFDPFYLAHSRVAHGDAPVAVFMSLSALAFFIYAERMRDRANRITLSAPGQMAVQSITNSPDDTKQPAVEQKNSLKFSLLSFILHPSSFILYLALSALFGGLAALTKAPGPFMALFVIGLSALYAGLDLWPLVTQKLKTTSQTTNSSPLSAPRSPLPASRIIIRWTTPVAIWGLISLLIFILLWPSMWVDPLGTFRQMWGETFGKVNEGHLVYFFGAPTLDPGFWFYVYVIPFRLTPVVLIGSVISLVLLVTGNRGRSAEGRTVFLLWFFIVSLWLFGTLSPKKQDRYLLPLFPFLDLLAAIGWLGCVDLLVRRFRSNFALSSSPSYLPTLALVLLLFIQFMPVVTYYPYYLTYFNPLLGGPTRAAETTLMGWGEGMEQVAAYLNTKPNAGSLYVASTPSQTLLPYFAGTGENFYTNDIAFRADYVVLYLAQMQRLAPSPEIVRYFEAQQPEKVITIKEVPYAKIYPGPKLILPDIPPQAIPANLGLEDTMRLAGYKIAPDSSSGAAPDGSPDAGLSLTLYWHALKPLPTDYTVSVRLRAADGRLLFQQDSWPIDGLLPTSQWRQGDYVADTHTLEITDSELEQANNFEIVVYNQETGATLGPPLTLPAAEAASQ
jgi:hypothetical protein